MGSYSKFISEVRRAVPTPKDLVADGKCVFGTFDKEFETMDMLNLNNPTSSPNEKNYMRLTLWEATEVFVKEGMLLTVIAHTDLNRKSIFTVFYDNRTKKHITWRTMVDDMKIAPSLINGAIGEAVAEDNKARIYYKNDFQDGKCYLEGFQDTEAGKIEYSFDMTRVSDPCIVSIPFEDPAVRHRPLYSQKDLFKITGKLIVNGEELTVDEESAAIVDDHRGYYPRHAHYDWLTTMGKLDNKWFGFNLTRNQSIDQDKYNENILWLENASSLLPPCTFERSIPSIEFKDYALWKLRDEHDMVHVDFHVHNIMPSVIDIENVYRMRYFVALGVLEGYLRDEDGNKYILDGMQGMGEDKTIDILLDI